MVMTGKSFCSFLLGLLIILLSNFVYPAQSHYGRTELTYYDKEKAFNGYTLFSPFRAPYTFLMDMDGKIVHSWKRPDGYSIEKHAVLLENGNIVWALGTGRDQPAKYQEVDWEGNLVWELQDSREGYIAHHDFLKIWNKKLNAPTLLIVSSRAITHEQAIAAGCDPTGRDDYTSVPDGVVELDLEGNIVWEWNIFDHLIQDIDPTKANYVGDGKTIADYPGKMDANFGDGRRGDWIHTNSLDYNESLDQVAINNSKESEFYVVDHGATFVAGDSAKSIELAASIAGDFLFRWGNPSVSDAGEGIRCDEAGCSEGDQQMFFTHDIQWIREGLPGAGNFLIFDNGSRHLQTTHSTVFEINPYDGPMKNGIYIPQMDAGSDQRLSNQVVWKYSSGNPCSFYARNISGAQRMPNGNTVICSGTWGQFFEVTKEGEVVWEYINPCSRAGVVKIIGDGEKYENPVFRIHRYAPDYPGLKGRDLAPKGKITEIYPEGTWASSERGGGGRREGGRRRGGEREGRQGGTLQAQAATESCDPEFTDWKPRGFSETARPNIYIVAKSPCGAEIDISSVEMLVDDSPVEPTVEGTGSEVTFRYTPTSLLEEEADHSVMIRLKGKDGKVVENEWVFWVDLIY
jgi:hypothetical protein